MDNRIAELTEIRSHTKTFAIETKLHAFESSSPALVSKFLNRTMKTSKTNCSHLTFGSNSPSFRKICLAASEKNKKTSSLAYKISDNFYLHKTVLSVSKDVPAILSAVGLGKLNYGEPKTYGKNKEISYNKSAVTLDEIDVFKCNEHFGKLD